MITFQTNEGSRSVNVRISYEDDFIGITVEDDKTGREMLDIVTNDAAQIKMFATAVQSETAKALNELGD